LSAADTTINGGPAELARFTTTAPGSGVLVVTLEGNALLNYDAANASSVTDSGSLGLCNATATLDAANCGQTIEVFSQDADNASGTNATDQFSITRVIPVPAGATTLYLNALEGSPGEFGVEEPPRVTAIWMPDTGTLPLTEGP
jgi:hypothetical protein